MVTLRLGYVQLGQVQLGQVKLCQVRLVQVQLGQVRQVRLDGTLIFHFPSRYGQPDSWTALLLVCRCLSVNPIQIIIQPSSVVQLGRRVDSHIVQEAESYSESEPYRKQPNGEIWLQKQGSKGASQGQGKQNKNRRSNVDGETGAISKETVECRRLVQGTKVQGNHFNSIAF